MDWDVTVIVGRDPRDMLVSLRNHMANMKPESFPRLAANATGPWRPPEPPPEDFRTWFRQWIQSSGTYDEGTATSDVLYYVQSFWRYRELPNVLMVHYSDLKADLAGEMRRIARFLDIEIPESDPVMSVVFEVDRSIQIPANQFIRTGRTYQCDGYDPHWRGIYDDQDRLMVAINFNMDLADAWEHANDPLYPEAMTGRAIRFAVNYVIYSMTH